MTRKDESHLRWQTLSRKTMADYRIFTVDEVQRRAEGNREGSFFLVEAPSWVTIIPVLKDEAGNVRFLIERQYRHGNDEITSEFPAGMVEPGEDPAVAAARELREETGYRAGKLTKIGDINPNPAFMTNLSYTYLAEDLVKEGGQELDAHEMVEVIEMTEKEVLQQMGQPPFHSAIMVQAWFWYLKHRKIIG